MRKHVDSRDRQGQEALGVSRNDEVGIEDLADSHSYKLRSDRDGRNRNSNQGEDDVLVGTKAEDLLQLATEPRAPPERERRIPGHRWRRDDRDDGPDQQHHRWHSRDPREWNESHLRISGAPSSYRPMA